jgi:hypothetical protein
MVRLLCYTNLIPIRELPIIEARTMQILSIEELHRLTMREIQDYTGNLWDLWVKANKIKEYRMAIGDDWNPFLLEANNATVEDVEEEE